MQQGLDPLDLKILARYQQNTRAAAEAIGKEVGLSAAAVQRRLKRMRGDGVIVGEVALVAPEHVGKPTTCVVGVRVEREGRAENARFKKAMLARPEVQQCYAVTGDIDYILVVLTRDMREFDAFTDEALYGDGNVRGFTTFVALDRVKTGVSVPIDLG
jgi:DNA-binding Lrp family transcriptional regulator